MCLVEPVWCLDLTTGKDPVSIQYKSIAGRYRPVSYPDGPITARYRFIKNARWDLGLVPFGLLGRLYSMIVALPGNFQYCISIFAVE